MFGSSTQSTQAATRGSDRAASHSLAPTRNRYLIGHLLYSIGCFVGKNAFQSIFAPVRLFRVTFYNANEYNTCLWRLDSALNAIESTGMLAIRMLSLMQPSNLVMDEEVNAYWYRFPFQFAAWCDHPTKRSSMSFKYSDFLFKTLMNAHYSK